jgi:hypothetical protein
LDTGVDKTHPFLSGKVVAEACFSNNGNCPNGKTTQIGSGAGVPCTYAAGVYMAPMWQGLLQEVAHLFPGLQKGQTLSLFRFSREFTGEFVRGQGRSMCFGIQF